MSGDTLYGTAFQGGGAGNGTVFALNTNGTGFTNLYSFTATAGTNYTNSDGAFPRAVLILSGDTLYGMASQGGSAGNGTVFALDTNGSGFTNLYNFTATAGSNYTNSDGAYPFAGLILSGDTLYGTALQGGGAGNGTVFALNTSGSAFTNLYSFTATAGTNSTNSDGAFSRAVLILSGDTLYGTAFQGGGAGNGTVFALSLPAESSVSAQPVIASLSLAGADLALNGISGQSGGMYYVLMSTNLTLPLSQWTPVATNVLSASGNFTITVTNTVTPNASQSFYILETQ